jgi:lysophospholipase L1-like esterase
MLQMGTPPPPELFVDDGLHLSDQGYQMWNDILMPVLQQVLSDSPTPSRPEGLELR